MMQENKLAPGQPAGELTDEEIARLHDSMFPAPYEGHANVVRFARALLSFTGKAAVCKHVLYETTDKDRPKEICDRNGEVVLAMCKLCGKVEAELDENATTERKGPLSKDQIREVFLAHGFVVKDGQTDLKPYVYDAAYALIALVQPATERKREPEELV